MSNADLRSGNPARRAAANRTSPDATGLPTGKAILWASNSPWAETGYGQQTAQVVRQLKKDGHQVAIASNYGLEGTIADWEGMPHFPRGFDMYSNDVVPAYMRAWAHQHENLDPLLITLFDVWVYKGNNWDLIPKIASWVPIDHFPVPPDVREWCARDNVTPLTMSKFGQEMLTNAGIESHYIPHAIDTQVFKPTESFLTQDREPMTGRQFMGVPEDAFVVGMVSANKGIVPNRKSFPEAFLAFGMFAEHNPDAVLYVHTEASAAMGGIDLVSLAEACGIPKDKIFFPDPFVWRMGIPNQVLATVYTAMDVFLQPSMGEGFGIPSLEAQACGTRVIVSDATAQPELLGDGWLVECQPWWDAAQKSWLVAPKIESILRGLVEAKEAPRERSETAQVFAAQYEHKKVFETHWRPVLGAL